MVGRGEVGVSECCLVGNECKVWIGILRDFVVGGCGREEEGVDEVVEGQGGNAPNIPSKSSRSEEWGMNTKIDWRKLGDVIVLVRVSWSWRSSTAHVVRQEPPQQSRIPPPFPVEPSCFAFLLFYT
jgi:hypothetical protein